MLHRTLVLALFTILGTTACGPRAAPGESGTQAPPVGIADADNPAAGAEETGAPAATPSATPPAEPPAEPSPGPQSPPANENHASRPAPASPQGRLAGILDAHNQFRQRHCAQPLRWSAKLASAAQTWADTLNANSCAFEHDRNTQNGENLAFFTPIGRIDAAGAVTGWYDEVAEYDFDNPGFSARTGHFTQVVWTDSEQLGCGVTSCNGGEIWVCRYSPSGNYRGQYKDRVLPTTCR